MDKNIRWNTLIDNNINLKKYIYINKNKNNNKNKGSKLKKVEENIKKDNNYYISNIKKFKSISDYKKIDSLELLKNQEILSNYSIGNLKEFRGIEEGIENTNYFLLVDNNKYILTIYEKRVKEKNLPF